MFAHNHKSRARFQLVILLLAVTSLLFVGGGVMGLCFGMAGMNKLFPPSRAALQPMLTFGTIYSWFHAPFVASVLFYKQPRFLMVPILLAPCIAGVVYFFGAYFPVFPPAVGFFLYTLLVGGATILLRYVLLDRVGLKPGHCVCCDYDLTGNESGRCPECGEQIQTPTDPT